jgi:hypothetical protein
MGEANGRALGRSPGCYYARNRANGRAGHRWRGRLLDSHFATGRVWRTTCSAFRSSFPA